MRHTPRTDVVDALADDGNVLAGPPVPLDSGGPLTPVVVAAFASRRRRLQ
jgi:hypothetical protein